MADQGTRNDQNDESGDGTYPDKYIKQFPGGFRVMVQNKRGQETLRVASGPGTYVEMDKQGNLKVYSTGEIRMNTKGGKVETVEENSDTRIAGHVNKRVGGGEHTEIGGDSGTVVGGNFAMAGLGNMGVTAKGNYYLGAENGMNFNSEHMDVQAKSTIKAQAITITMNAAGGVEINGPVRINGNVEIIGDLNQTGGGNIGAFDPD